MQLALARVASPLRSESAAIIFSSKGGATFSGGTSMLSKSMANCFHLTLRNSPGRVGWKAGRVGWQAGGVGWAGWGRGVAGWVREVASRPQPEQGQVAGLTRLAWVRVARAVSSRDQVESTHRDNSALEHVGHRRLDTYGCSLGAYGCSLDACGCSLGAYGCSLDAYGCSLGACGRNLGTGGCSLDTWAICRAIAALSVECAAAPGSGSWA